jgi:hypothetical protein
MTSDVKPGLVPHGEPPTYFTFPGLAAPGLPHATTTRHCPGLRPFAHPAGPFAPEAYGALAAAGIDVARAAYARRQAHGADAATVAAAGPAGVADVLVTTEPGRPLAIFTADCLAIILWDPRARVLAVAHVGWRGTVRGAAQAAVAAARGAGARPDALHAAIAPSIGPCCYEVDAPVIRAFTDAYGGAASAWMGPGRGGHAMLDLWAANEALLVEAGVRADRVENPHLCTACHPDLLYSYRRRDLGRLVTVAALP